MKIAFFVTRLEKPSARYRVLQYLPYLKEQDWEPEVFVIPKALLQRQALFRKARSFDVVFLQKKLLSRWDLSLLRQNARRLIYDLDDAVMFRDSWKGRHDSFKRKWAFARTVRKADRVIAGNRYLEGLSRSYSDKVSFLATPLLMDRYSMKDYGDGETKKMVTLGWIGSAATIKYLEIIRGALEEVAVRFPDVHLKIVSDRFLSFQRIPVQEKIWNADDEISDLHSFDVGLMPLTDDVWSRGKCGFKILQYMAAGVSVVCSPVGMNREIVQDGVQGFWSEEMDEWVEKLSVLINDPALRKRMGTEGRRRVSENYSLEVNAPKFMEILNSL